MDKPFEIEANNVSIEDEIPVIYVMVEEEVPNMDTSTEIEVIDVTVLQVEEIGVLY